jgi:hypothetical protein
MAFTLSEEVGCLNSFAGPADGIVHCGLGSGLRDAGLNTGGGRAAFGFEGFELVNFELIRANSAVLRRLPLFVVSIASPSDSSDS